jgi:inorganic pyrophosphatase
VPTDKLCKSYHNIKCINDIHVTLKDQIEHFFTYYKDLDEGKWVKIDGWGNAEEAK